MSVPRILLYQDAYTDAYIQAASAIDTLKMSDSPVKKLNFESTANKENVYKPIVGIPDIVEDDAPKKLTTAPTIKEEEAHEPLLQENPQRFVLFPIKYHDVSRRVITPPHASCRVFYAVSLISTVAGLANVQEGRSFFLDCRGD